MNRQPSTIVIYGIVLAKLPLRLLGLILLTLAIVIPGCQALFRFTGAPFHPGFRQQQQLGRPGRAATPDSALASP
jgi:hypothetical protein